MLLDKWWTKCPIIWESKAELVDKVGQMEIWVRREQGLNPWGSKGEGTLCINERYYRKWTNLSSICPRFVQSLVRVGQSGLKP